MLAFYTYHKIWGWWYNILVISALRIEPTTFMYSFCHHAAKVIEIIHITKCLFKFKIRDI